VSIGRELLVEVVAELRRDPSLACELRGLLGGGEHEHANGPQLQRLSAWARQTGISVRLAREWIAEGMPHVRRGRVVLVELGAAAQWLASSGHAEQHEHEPGPSAGTVPEPDRIAQAAARAARRARRVAA
jgi:hypothetical protein